jgi:ribosomal protein S11
MAATKMHDWDTATDGVIPVQSERTRGWTCVRITDTEGESFGWESPDGRLLKGALITPSAAEQTAMDAAHAAALVTLNALQAKEDLRATLKAKRESAQSLTSAERDSLADLVLGV